MKKRLLSLLMALCLMLSLVPAAFATDGQPETITLPNGEVREIPNVDVPNTPATLSAEEDDTSNVVIIDSEAKFASIGRTSTEWYSGKTFKITADLNLALVTAPEEWDGYIQYFYGHLIGEKADGSAPVISGIPDNCGFIYGIIGGTIENLTFSHAVTSDDNGASYITFMPTTMESYAYHLTMKDVTVTGNISLTGSDQSNYSPFVFCASAGGLTMENCINKANISGNIYGSVFYGYYPLYATSYVFDNCVNYGDITMQYAGMFFGNSSTLETKLNNTAFSLNISDCANYGEIRGTSGVSYLVAPVAPGSIGATANAIEAVLNPPEESVAATTLPERIDVSKIATSNEEIEKTGSLCKGSKLTGFTATLSTSDPTVLNITRPTDENEKGVDHYTVAVSTYVNLWYSGDEVTPAGFYGTDRYTVKENISVSSLSQTSNTFQPALKVYGVADSNAGTIVELICDYLVLATDDNTRYYMVEDHMTEGDFSLYVSSNTDENGPVGGGTKAAQIVTVSAYDANGAMLGCVTVNLA